MNYRVPLTSSQSRDRHCTSFTDRDARRDRAAHIPSIIGCEPRLRGIEPAKRSRIARPCTLHAHQLKKRHSHVVDEIAPNQTSRRVHPARVAVFALRPSPPAAVSSRQVPERPPSDRMSFGCHAKSFRHRDVMVVGPPLRWRPAAPAPFVSVSGRSRLTDQQFGSETVDVSQVSCHQDRT